MKENWKIIQEAPEYAVSDQGRVMRISPDRMGRGRGKILATPLNDKGYKCLNLHIAGKQRLKRVHVLVCDAFNGLRQSPKDHCRHLNGDKLDNPADNLKWGTCRENQADTMAHGRIKRGEDRSFLTEHQVRFIKSSSMKQADLAAMFGCARTTVSSIKNGYSWGHVA